MQLENIWKIVSTCKSTINSVLNENKEIIYREFILSEIFEKVTLMMQHQASFNKYISMRIFLSNLFLNVIHISVNLYLIIKIDCS